MKRVFLVTQSLSCPKAGAELRYSTSELDHVRVVPSTHVSRISALPAEEMAHLLAALRRVALAQQQEGAAFNLRTIELLGSHGHICIRVARSPSSEPPGSLGDNPSMVARLRSALETVQ